jgi:hypothetical protein
MNIPTPFPTIDVPCARPAVVGPSVSVPSARVAPTQHIQTAATSAVDLANLLFIADLLDP